MGVEWETLQNMERYGGNFVKHLALLYRLADERNKSRLERCFEDYFDEYKNLKR